jgi:c(7)-type cytochrome triheme protein
MNYSLILIMISMILGLHAGNASSKGCEDNIVFEGGGAGQVVFNAAVHTSRGYTCSYCHEGRGFSFALFDMKKGSDTITMRKMALGSSCGYCHDGKKAFSTTDNLGCSKCHRK